MKIQDGQRVRVQSEEPSDLVAKLADLTLGLFRAADANHSVHFILAGGKSPRAVYTAWLDSPDVDWRFVHFYFGDERCVPPTDERSNFKMFNDVFLGRLDAHPPHVHRIEGEQEPETAARAYADIIRNIGTFDGALLGVGEDCHTASLFPGDVVNENSLTIVAKRPDAVRISLNYPVFERCRFITFFVPGEKKVEALRQIIGREPLPASRVANQENRLILTTTACVARLMDTDAKDYLSEVQATTSNITMWPRPIHADRATR